MIKGQLVAIECSVTHWRRSDSGQTWAPATCCGRWVSAALCWPQTRKRKQNVFLFFFWYPLRCSFCTKGTKTLRRWFEKRQRQGRKEGRKEAPPQGNTTGNQSERNREKDPKPKPKPKPKHMPCGLKPTLESAGCRKPV